MTPKEEQKHTDLPKGESYDGPCNVTACQNPHAIYWNTSTCAYYCQKCASGINEYASGAPLCVHPHSMTPYTRKADCHEELVGSDKIKELKGYLKASEQHHDEHHKLEHILRSGLEYVVSEIEGGWKCRGEWLDCTPPKLKTILANIKVALARATNHQESGEKK